AEQRAGKIALLGDQSGRGVAQVVQLLRVADVDHAEGLVVAQLQGQLAVGTLQILDVQGASAGGVEQSRTDVGKQVVGRHIQLGQVAEAIGEDVLAIGRHQALTQRLSDRALRRRPVSGESSKELQDLHYVRSFALVEALGDAAANKDPQRPFEV